MDDVEDEMENYVYKPCRKCGSVSYTNTDGETFKELPNGKLSVQPTTCDKCTFDLMMNKTNTLQ